MSNKKKIILLIVLLSYFITAIDSSIVFTSLEKMTFDLQLNQVTLSWVQNAYTLAFGGFILLGGRLSDVFGRKKVLNIALVLFGVSSAIAGASFSANIMILARFIQGIGASILAPTSLALLMDTFKGKERVKAVAWYSSISGLGSSIGLILGGLLASFSSWRDGFYINVPITIFMLILSIRTLDNKQKEKENFDTIGTVFSILGIFAFVYAINGANLPILWLIVSVILLVLFVFIEYKSKVPIMPLELFKDKTRVGAYIVRTIYMCAMLGFWFYLSECLQKVFHYSPIMTGISFFPMTISMFISAVYVPNLINRCGNKKILLWGNVFLIAGFIWTLFITENSKYLIGIALPLVLLGFGQGFSMSPLTNLGIHNTKFEIAGSASGLVNVAHQIGGSIGLSIMVASNKEITSMMAGFHRAMIIGLLFTIGMLLIGLLFFKNYKGE